MSERVDISAIISDETYQKMRKLGLDEEEMGRFLDLVVNRELDKRGEGPRGDQIGSDAELGLNQPEWRQPAMHTDNVESYSVGGCDVESQNTQGDYYCTREPGHAGPCTAVPRKRK